MDMKPSCYLIVCFLLFASGCQTPSAKGQKSEPNSLLNGTTRVLKVDRICKHPRVGYPHNELQEFHYTKDTQGISYAIKFSADGTAVTVVMEKPIEGTLVSDIDGKRIYSLKAFTGGRLILEPAGTSHEAELTIYGSGVPIISSVRGKVFKNELSNKPDAGDGK